jgi:cardiolipin synthase A/B
MTSIRNSGARKRSHLRAVKSYKPDVSTIFGLREQARAFVRQHGWWKTSLLLIGLVTVLAVLGALFVAAGDTPDSIFTDAEVPPVQSALFATTLSNLINAPMDQGGTVSILNNGDEFLPALLDAIRNARHTINFSVYIWRDGIFSRQVLDSLVEAQRRHVAVRLLLDGFGVKDVPDWRFGELKRAGGRVEKFRTPQFGKLTRFHRRNHRRSIVIDGEIGFTGGMAVADSWLGHAQDPDHWRDMMFKVTGPLARSLQGAFASSWVGSSGEILTGRDMYPLDGNNSPPGVERFINLVNSPAADHHSMADFFIMSILAARKSLYIVTPYFIPDKHLKRALEQKAEEGIDVHLLLPGKNIDNRMVRLSAEANYQDLLEAGVKIHEYGPSFIHTKFMVVDREWSIIGSPNLNSRSRQLDEENAQGILDKRFGEQLINVFLTDLEHSDEIKLDDWRRRNFLWRFVERLAQVLDKQS